MLDNDRVIRSFMYVLQMELCVDIEIQAEMRKVYVDFRATVGVERRLLTEECHIRHMNQVSKLRRSPCLLLQETTLKHELLF